MYRRFCENESGWSVLKCNFFLQHDRVGKFVHTLAYHCTQQGDRVAKGSYALTQALSLLTVSLDHNLTRARNMSFGDISGGSWAPQAPVARPVSSGDEISRLGIALQNLQVNSGVTVCYDRHVIFSDNAICRRNAK
jgi:hypothetical protein